jgi:HlyD family secretion protein
MKRPPFRLLLAAVALAGAAAATQLALQANQKPPASPPTYQPAVRDKDGLLAASGLVEAVAENTLVGVPFAGLVAEVPAKVSRTVKAGDPLLVLDTRELRPAAAAALAAAERAEDVARRMQPLRGTGAVSESALNEAQFAAREARARADLAAAQLDRATVRSPIDGTVLQVSVRAGEFVAAGGKPPVVVGDISRLQIRCDIDEQMAPRMRENLPARGYLKGEAARAGAAARPIPLRFVRIEPFVIPKASLTGASIERVDTRVLQVIYQFDRLDDRPVFVGQQMDVYIDTTPDAK